MKRFAVVLVAVVSLCPVSAFARPWTRSYVVDERIAALRTEPRLTATVAKRLRTGRMVAIVSRTRDANGLSWVRVAVTRRTRGWLLELAIAAPADRAGNVRLADMLDTTTGYERLRLSRLALDHFPRLGAAGLAAFREESAAAAALLSRRLAARDDLPTGCSAAVLRAFLLSDPLLDRYSRLGVAFDVDSMTRTVTARPVAR